MQRAPSVRIVLLVSLALAGSCKNTLTGADSGPPSDAVVDAATCELDAVYRFGPDGGLEVARDEVTLTPPASYSHRRQFFLPEGGETSCAPALPACDDPNHLDVADIMRDLDDADVRVAMALATPPIYGLDLRPVDGVLFRLRRADGRGFDAGDDCDVDAHGEVCHGHVPAGVARLVADLEALDQQQRMLPECLAAGLDPTAH